MEQQSREMVCGEWRVLLLDLALLPTLLSFYSSTLPFKGDS